MKGSSVGGDPLRNVLSGPISFAVTCESSTWTGIICPPSTTPRSGHGVIGIKRERAVAATQIRRAHARQGVSPGFYRREIRGHEDDRVGHAVIIQRFPEGLALAKLLGSAPPERDHPAAHVNAMLWRFHARSRKIGLQRFGVAMDEIKNAMPACVHAGDQVRPGDRALWWNAGGEQAKRPLSCQCRKIRHPALGHVLLQQLRVHPVNAQNDELLITVPSPGLAGKQEASRSAHQQEETQVPDS